MHVLNRKATGESLMPVSSSQLLNLYGLCAYCKSFMSMTCGIGGHPDHLSQFCPTPLPHPFETPLFFPHRLCYKSVWEFLARTLLTKLDGCSSDLLNIAVNCLLCEVINMVGPATGLRLQTQSMCAGSG